MPPCKEPSSRRGSASSPSRCPRRTRTIPGAIFQSFKVGANKVFAWLTVEPKAAHVTLKLTAEEREVAHLLPYVSIARYVGRYGWVTATVTDEETLAAALEWLRESYWLKAPAKVREAAWSQSA
jgi:predicted DNA-binding protein (MmcQ/YjbR family)